MEVRWANRGPVFTTSFGRELFFYERRTRLCLPLNTPPDLAVNIEVELQHLKELIRSKRPVDMSQSNQSIPKNIEPAVASKSDHDDQASSSSAEKVKQDKDTAKDSPERPQSPSTKKNSTATKAVTPGLGSNTNRVYGAGGASASDEIKYTSHPCGPCQWRELQCDGVHPMCNNCEWNGRRCDYD